MKKFLPYFKLLLPVKWRFILALVAGVVYGLASGFGLPFMSAKVFPLIFSSEQKGISLYLKETGANGKHHMAKKITDFSSIESLYYKKEPTSDITPLPETSSLNTRGEIEVDGSKIQTESLYYKTDQQEYKAVEPFLYLKKSEGKYQKITDLDETKKDNTLLYAVLLLPGVFLIRGVAGYVNNYYISYCGQFVLERIRSMVFCKLQALDLAYFQKMGTGDLMTRFLVQTTRLQNVITSTSNSLIKEPVALLSALGALIYLSVQNKASIFILFSVAIIPICVIPVRKFSSIMLKKLRGEAKGEIKIGSHLQENIAGARDIRSFNLEDREINIFHGLLAGFFKQRMKMTKYKGLVMPTVEIITATGVSVAIFYSAKNGMSLETVIPLIVALYMSYEPVRKLSGLQTQLVFGQLAIEMIDKILNREEKVKDPENPKALPDLKGGITFDDVVFKYDTGKPALRKISVAVKPGEVVALVGPSGAGKSTFTHLISRTYEITKGKIYFDEHDVTEHRLADLRSQVAVVSQSPYLFDDTVKNNIRLGKLDATDEEIMVAADQANCLEFIQKLPNGIDTVCGENATLLSGGQKQRLAIARAFLKDAPILILDEATSALDAESEQVIQSALSKLVKGRTTFIIAHRFSSIQIAERILVFDSGKIKSDGSHEELMASSNLYKELYHKQSI